MGLLMSEATLLDPPLDDTMRWPDGLSMWAYVPDAPHGPYQNEAADPTE